MSAWTHGRRAAPNNRNEPTTAACVGVEALAIHSAESLLRTVESEIIPRLMLLHQTGGHAAVRPNHAAKIHEAANSEMDVEGFADLVLQGHDAAFDYLQAQLAHGTPVASLCLSLLAPTARRLGELWEADLCDFTQVTIALGRLHALLRGLTAAMADEHAPLGWNAVFVPAPGEQHTFGLAIVRNFFRAAGWTVRPDAPEGKAALLALLRSQHLDLIGFSIGAERNADALGALITAARSASCNRRLRVLVGGPLLLREPERAVQLGADASADDARQAILEANRLMAAEDEGR